MVAFTLYRLNSQQYLRAEAIIEQQRNLRLALYTLAREIRMAGNGLFVLGQGLKIIQIYAPVESSRDCNDKPIVPDSLAWYANCDSSSSPGVRAIFGEDGGASSSDIVTVFKAEPEFSTAIGRASGFDDWRLALIEPIDANSIAAGDILGLINGEKACLLEVKEVSSGGTISEIEIKDGGRFTGPNGPPSGFATSGAIIYNLKNVSLATYYLDEATNQLMVVYHDQAINEDDPKASPPTPIADHIEDFQLHYFFDKEEVDVSKVSLDPGIDSAKLADKAVRAVIVGLTAKSDVERYAAPQIRPPLFNRAAGTVAEKVNRLSILETVHLRNAQ
jgi:hypothetical protein